MISPQCHFPLLPSHQIRSREASWPTVGKPLAFALAVFLLSLGGLFVPAPTHAGGFPEATVEYSALEHVTQGNLNVTARIFSAIDKERHEPIDRTAVRIFRMDKGVMWMLLPESKMYYEQPLDENEEDLSDEYFKTKEIGPETIDNIDTVKIRFDANYPDGGAESGFMWLTQEGNIILKREGIVSDAMGTDEYSIMLTELKIGKQDPALFEIPGDYNDQPIRMGVQ